MDAQKNIDQLNPTERHLAEFSMQAAAAGSKAIREYISNMPDKELDAMSTYGFTSFVYNALSIMCFDLLMSLNESNNISLEDAKANVDGLIETVKTMLDKNWHKVTKARQDKGLPYEH